MYTKGEKSDSVNPDLRVLWVGDSLKVLREFPPHPRYDLGNDLRRLQKGLSPLDSAPVPGTGSNGVVELRAQDSRAWYRVVCLKKIKNSIYVLHCFEKHTNQIDSKNMKTIKSRLKVALAADREEEKDEKGAAGDRAHHEGKRSRRPGLG